MAFSKLDPRIHSVALILLGSANDVSAQQNGAAPVSLTPMLIVTVSVIILVAGFMVLATWLSADRGHSEPTGPAKDFGAEGQAAAGVAAFEKARVVAKKAEEAKAKGLDHEEVMPADSSRPDNRG